MRKVRSETLRTRTPGSESSSVVMSSTWSALATFAVMSTTIASECDSTTSNAVSTPPTRPTEVVRSPAALADGGASTRMVIE